MLLWALTTLNYMKWLFCCLHFHCFDPFSHWRCFICISVDSSDPSYQSQYYLLQEPMHCLEFNLLWSMIVNFPRYERVLRNYPVVGDVGCHEISAVIQIEIFIEGCFISFFMTVLEKFLFLITGRGFKPPATLWHVATLVVTWAAARWLVLSDTRGFGSDTETQTCKWSFQTKVFLNVFLFSYWQNWVEQTSSWCFLIAGSLMYFWMFVFCLGGLLI